MLQRPQLEAGFVTQYYADTYRSRFLGAVAGRNDVISIAHSLRMVLGVATLTPAGVAAMLVTTG